MSSRLCSVQSRHGQFTTPSREGRARWGVGVPSPPLVAAAAPSHKQRLERPRQPSSLIPSTLEDLDSDSELRQLHERVAAVGQAALTREEEKARLRSLAALGAPPFLDALRSAGCRPLVRDAHVSTLQLNIGLFCNQACQHCHVEASPRRTELMSRAVAERCIELAEPAAAAGTLKTLDLTGGAPELAPQFRYLVEAGSRLGLEVIDRCNLTVLLEPGQEDLVDFLAAHRVHVVASMPCYSAANVDKQRGGGVFERSIQGLQVLNAAGYGMPGSGLELDLVYNPGGAFLAPSASSLEPAYRQELGDAHGITFSRLLCLNNMPIKRWVDWLQREGKLEDYMSLLVQAFNPAAAEGLMCRGTLSVGWDGRLHDCDFNQQLALGLAGRHAGATVFDLPRLDALAGAGVATGSHCYGCTAGAGSGCQGATS